MIGNRLITKQTSAEGVSVNEVMIAEAVNLKKERYLAILLDRESTCPVVVVSSEGGVNIEDLARKSPSSIHREKIDIVEGVTKEKANKIATALGFKQGTPQSRSCAEQIIRLYRLFTDLDCLQVEINPLGETVEGKVVNLDAKFVFDSNAIYRQPRVAALAAESRRLEVEASGPNSIPALEFAAENHGLSYIGLPSGNIGCMVNGAGLAMATLDLLSMFNGRPANFLDLGGRANQSDVAFAIRTLTSDERIRCILINIFGGIVNCKMVAEGIVEACKSEAPKVPVIVRLEGTNAVEGRKFLEAYGRDITVVAGMEEAAKLACASVK
ncbi:Succinate--CoA ligase [GDP-forming] subunit beta, mitochondrial [Sparganum proliferum]